MWRIEDGLAIPADVSMVMAKLINHGYRVWIVGGAVRDLLIGEHPYDWDLVVEGKLDDLAVLFPHPKIIGRDRKRVCRFMAGCFGVEIAPIRGTDIVSDLSCRDFTVNAMAVSSDGSLFDPFGGRADVENGILRFTGNPSERIEEDPIRLLRMCRFASSLELDIYEPHFEEACSRAEAILSISLERIGNEMLKGLRTKCGTFWDLVERTGLASFILPFRPVDEMDIDIPFPATCRIAVSVFMSGIMHLLQDCGYPESFPAAALFLPFFLKLDFKDAAEAAEREMVSWSWPVKTRRNSLFFAGFALRMLSHLEAGSIYELWLASCSSDKLHDLFVFSGLVAEIFPERAGPFLYQALALNLDNAMEIFNVLGDRTIFLPAGEISELFSVPHGPELGNLRLALALEIAGGRIKTRKESLDFLSSAR